jgi:hypothetical protein
MIEAANGIRNITVTATAVRKDLPRRERVRRKSQANMLLWPLLFTNRSRFERPS